MFEKTYFFYSYSHQFLCALFFTGVDPRWSVTLWFFIQRPIQAAETNAQKRWQLLQQEAAFRSRTRWTARQKTLRAKQWLRGEKFALPCPAKFIAREASHRTSWWVLTNSTCQMLSESSRHFQTHPEIVCPSQISWNMLRVWFHRFSSAIGFLRIICDFFTGRFGNFYLKPHPSSWQKMRRLRVNHSSF